jgi:hypothetical protein
MEGKKTDRECQNVKVVILMMAHDGVKNDASWSSWMEETFQMGMICYIYEMEKRNSVPNSKLGNVFLASKECLSMKSAWGHYSTPLVCIQLLEEGMKIFPRAVHFILLSGRCLPLVPPLSIIAWSGLNLQHSVFYTGSGLHPYVVEGKFYVNDEPAWPVEEQPKGTKLKFMNGPNKGKMFTHPIQTHDMRWIVNRCHAYLISQFRKNGMRALKTLDAKFSNPKLYKLKEQKRKVAVAPDEYWILLILKLQGVDDAAIINHIVSYQIMADPDDSNPITWKDLDEAKMYFLNNPGNPKYDMHPQMTLRQAIQGCLLARSQGSNPSLFFLRKIELEDQSFNPWSCNLGSVTSKTIMNLIEAKSIPSAQAYDNDKIIRSTTIRLFNVYSHLHPEALTRSVVLDARERKRIRNRKLFERDKRRRLVALSKHLVVSHCNKVNSRKDINNYYNYCNSYFHVYYHYYNINDY